MRFHTLLITIFLLQNAFALPASARVSLMTNDESSAEIMESHCPDETVHDHDTALDCEMYCQCNFGSSIGTVEASMTSPHLQIVVKVYLQCAVPPRSLRPELLFRPPRTA